MEAASKKMGDWLANLVGLSLLQNGDDNSHVKIHDVMRDFVVKYAFTRPSVLGGKESPKIEMLIFSPPGKSRNIDDTGRHNVESPHEPVRDFTVKHVAKSHYGLDGKMSLKIETFITPAESSCKEISSDIVKSVIHDFCEKLANKGGRHVFVLEGEEPMIFISQAAEVGGVVEAPISEMESFFQGQGMDKLKVLHLENMCFSKGFLPIRRSPWVVEHVPILLLKDLVTLCLHNCNVKDLAGIGNLKGSLQVLSFCGSTVAKLLKEVGELSKLRSLDFRGCPKVKEIEAGALKGLSGLEELFLGNAFGNWGKVVVVEESGERINASLAELNSMPHLATLDIIIPDPNTMLPQHLPLLSQLQTYSLCIGPEWYRSEDDTTDDQLSWSRILKLNLESDRVLFNGWFQAALRRTQQLHLDGLDDDDTNRSSIHELCTGGFKELKHLQVMNSPSTRYIIHSTEWFHRSGFLSLEFLSLTSMRNLEKIGQGLLSPESFGKLKVVKVNDCNSLKSLFSLSSIHGLSQLESIQVTDCRVMEAVVVDEDKRIENEEDEEEDKPDDPAKEDNRVFFKCLPAGKVTTKAKTSTENNNAASTATDNKVIMQSLRHLKLYSLSNFSTFFTKVNQEINACLFLDEQVSLPKLTSLTLRRLKKVKEIWQVTKSPMDLDNLQSLVVKDCNNLLTIFHPTLLEKKLHKLGSLKVRRCRLIQVVFDLEELVSVSGKIPTILPQLKVLKLTDLEKLRYIISNKYPRELLGFGNLTSLDVHRCGKLEYLFTSTMVEAVKKLENIKVECCFKMKAIVKEEDEHGGASRIEFPDLKVLWINECPEMKGFSIQSNKQEMTTGGGYFFNKEVHLPSLVDLKLSSFGKFTHIWSNKTPAAESFSKLAGVEFEYCDELMTAFPAAMLDRLKDVLKEIKIHNCGSLEVLFELRASTDIKVVRRKRPVVFSHLKDIYLSDLPKLQHVVEKDSDILVGFPGLTRIHVSDCGMLRDLLPISTATTLSKLEILTLVRCSMIEEVVRVGDLDDENQINFIVFPLLCSLELEDLDELVYVSSASYQLDFPSLKKLSIENCRKMKIFSPETTCERFGSEDAEYLFNEKVGLPKLEELRVERMELKELWSTEPSFAGSFCQLKKLKVEFCHLQKIIPSFMLERLQNLVSLTVRYCSSVQHIVGGARADDETSIAFPYLTYLELDNVRKLSSFSQGSEAIELPSLKDLSIGGCKCVDAIAAVKDPNCSKIQIQQPLFWFDGEISIPSLERLYLESMDKMMMIWCGRVSTNGLSKLSVVRVRECDNLDTMFHLNMLPSLTNLVNLEIISCKSLQVIYDFHPLDLDEKSSDDTVVAAASAIGGLRDLKLEELPKLKHIWRSGVDDDPKAAVSRKIILKFEKLSSVQIWHCDGLSYIFPASAARSLSQLKNLVIRDNSGLEEIVGGRETKDDIDAPCPNFIFPQLDNLELHYLYNLKSFCGGMYTVECPLLSQLTIARCRSLQVLFASDSTTFHPMKEHPLFLVHKDSFPLLKKLILSYCSNLRRIWQHGWHSNACPFIKLTELELSGCNGLEDTLFPAGTLEIFLNLKKLHLIECNSLKVIYDVKSAHLILRLHQLKLSSCKKLEEIIARDPKEKEAARGPPAKFLFARLTSLELSDLPELKCVYPGPHVSHWPLLENLIISNCMSIGNISHEYSSEKDTPVTDNGNPRQPFFRVDQAKFRLLKTLTLSWNVNMERMWRHQALHPELFPKLQVVNLEGYFYADEPPLHLPSSSFIHKLQTEKLTVSKAFSCEVLFQRAAGPHDQEQVVPKVAHFTKLELNYLLMVKHIWEENFEPASMFINLESLQVYGCEQLIKVLPSSISFSSLTSLAVTNCRNMKAVMTLPAAKSLTQLSKMSVSWCHALVEIVATDDDGGNDEITFSQLKHLKLSSLERLTCFCSGKLYFPVLQELVVEECPWLTSISEGALTTPNLKRMQTDKGSLLVRDDLNTTLVEEQLGSPETLDLSKSPVWRGRWRIDESLSPRSFNDLKTLIIAEGDDGPDQLSTAIPLDKALLLRNLEKLEVRNCDALDQVFDSALDLGTPRKTICWTRLPVPAAASKKLRIDGIFNNLRSITIMDCGSLKYIFTTAMVLNLTQLQDFHIRRCPMLEEIVQTQDDDDDGVKCTRKETTAIEFPNLETITLDHLTRLERFCQLGNRSALNCPSLKKISIKNCHQMKIFASEMPRSVADERRGESVPSIRDSGINQEPFFCTEVQFPSLEDLILSDMVGLNTLFPNNKGETVYVNLVKVHISRCHKLKYVFPASVATSLVKLNELMIQGCGGLEEIVAAAANYKGSENAASTCHNGERRRLVFPTVTDLVLWSLPELKSFYKVGVVHTWEWPMLEKLIVLDCPKIETLALDIESCCNKSNLLLSDEAQVQGRHLLLHHIQTKQPLFLIGKDAFPRLKQMIIRNMDNMKRIWDFVDDRRINMITEEASASPQEIITLQPEYGSNKMAEDGRISFSFRRLRLMVLYELPRLVRFSSACFTFCFPSLKAVVIVGCPDMKTFSAGNSLTPEGCDVRIHLQIAESDSDGIDYDAIHKLISDQLVCDNKEEEYDDNDTTAKHCLINNIVQKQSTAIATQREDGDNDDDIMMMRRRRRME